MTNQREWLPEGKTKLNYGLKTLLIERYIGKEIFLNLKNKETRGVLTKEALNFFKQEMIREFGSLYNYQKWWAKRNGWKNIHEYITWLRNNQGFRTDYQYREHQARKKGFHSYKEKLDLMAKKKGFKDNYDYTKKKIVHKYGSIKEYLEAVAYKRGFSSYSERKRAYVSKALNNGKCMNCFCINGNGYKNCDKCLGKKKKYYLRNREKCNLKHKEYVQRNLDKIRAYALLYRNTPDYKLRKKEYDKRSRTIKKQEALGK